MKDTADLLNSDLDLLSSGFPQDLSPFCAMFNVCDGWQGNALLYLTQYSANIQRAECYSNYNLFASNFSVHQLSSVPALYALPLSQILSLPIPSAAGGFVTSSVGHCVFCREQQDQGLV